MSGSDRPVARGLLPGDLRGKVLRVGVEVLHQPLEVRGRGSGGKGGAAPVVEHGAGQIGVGGSELLEDEFSPAQTRFALRRYGCEEGFGGLVLPGQARLDGTNVGVEGLRSCGNGFG